MGIESRSSGWRVLNSLWIIISFFFLIHWSSVLYAGIRVKKLKWIILSAIYAIPTFVFMILNGTMEKDTFGENLVMVSFFMSWLATIITAFIIRKDFLIELDKLVAAPIRRFVPKTNVQTNFNNQRGYKGKHSGLMQKVMLLRGEIFLQIEKADTSLREIYLDLSPMVDKYVEKVKELISSDEKLSNIINNYSETEIDSKVEQMREKLSKTTNHELKREYEQSIVKYNEHKKSFQEIKDQSEMINLRLNSTLMTMQQIKFDMLKMSSLELNDKGVLLKSLEDKSNELSEYIDIVKDTYSNTGLA